METALPGKTRSPGGPGKLCKWAQLCQTVKQLVPPAPHVQELCAGLWLVPPDVSWMFLGLQSHRVFLWLLCVPQLRELWPLWLCEEEALGQVPALAEM